MRLPFDSPKAGSLRASASQSENHMKATRNTLTRQRAATLRKNGTPENTHFILFEDEGVVSTNGTVIVFAPNEGGKKTPAELKGKSLLVSDAKRIAKDLPKGRLGQEIELSAEKGQLFVKDARGTMHQAPLQLRPAKADFRTRLPQHDDYYEVAANAGELRAAIMSVEQLERDRSPLRDKPSITLRVSRNPEHPIEICGKGGAFAAVAPKDKSLIAHVFGRFSKWFAGKKAETAESEKRELVKV